ncbi:MAG: PDZ domain-containing protein [Cyanobacteria bacterium WB6_1B_304]|jgi:carboxyl-terminal processing protease|nr:PDZ domain-containing protein [Cyanobacteria bacterium WB6_1B_304]
MFQSPSYPPVSSSSVSKTSVIRLAICATATLSLVSPTFSRSVRAAFEDSPKVIVDQAWQIVNQEYVDPGFNRNNWLAVRHSLLQRQYTSKEEAYLAIRESLERLEDPYTRFLEPEQYKALTNQTSGEMSGVGLRLMRDEALNALTVTESIEDSPAMKSGIQEGDRILLIDGTSTRSMGVEQAAKLIRGEIGTKVTLRIQRLYGKPFEVVLTRSRIELPSVSYGLKEEDTLRVGYIRLNEFSAPAATQMRRAIRKLTSQKANAFVLDLRGNPGGLLQSSIDIARLWMDQGNIVRTVDRKGANDQFIANHTALTNLPMVVLVDHRSASSSEILTGALKDNQRAVVVGTTTFGKALVQSVHSLVDGSGLAVTVAHYYTPKGTDINQTGISPDINVDLTDSQRQTLTTNPKLIATPNDPQYAKAVAILQANIAKRSVQNLPEKTSSL